MNTLSIIKAAKVREAAKKAALRAQWIKSNEVCG